MKRYLWDPLQQLWTTRDLLRELITRELKLRYRRSALGFAWSLLTPLFQILVYTVVIKMIIGAQDMRNLSFDMLCAIVPWTFFSTGVTNSCASVLRYRNVVKKVYFPRQMLPLSVVGANLSHLFLSLLVLLVVFAVRPVAFHPMFGFILVLIALQTLLVAGLALIAACAHTYYQDVEYVLQNLMQIMMFLSPVLYRASRLDDLDPIYKHLFMLNPMAVFTEGWRGILIDKVMPDPYYLGIAAAVSVGMFLLGVAVWERYSWRFPEVL